MKLDKITKYDIITSIITPGNRNVHCKSSFSRSVIFYIAIIMEVANE